MADACRLGNRNIRNSDNFTATNHNENFCVFNVLCVFISLISILADLTTDIIVFAEYCKDGHFSWALGCLIFILAPNIIVNIFSLRWYIIDQTANFKHWLSHGFLVGLLERFIVFLHKVFVCKNWETIETRKLISQRNDLGLLHFLYIFTGTVPQIILQIYSITVLDDNYQTKVFALSASIASVFWGCATYMYSVTVFSNENGNWNSLLLKCVWHFCMLISRIQGILLFTIIFHIWTLLLIGLHWSAMTIWIITQKTNFCPNKLEEVLYNVVMGFVYCFFYINLREGHSRYRLLLFYTLMVSQNIGSLFLYVLLSDAEYQTKSWSMPITMSIIFCTIFGMAAMILYYRFFHYTGPMLWKNNHPDIELNNKYVKEIVNKADTESSLKHVRSFKNYHLSPSENMITKNTTEELSKQENENTDKKILLHHWNARSATPTCTSMPGGHISMDASSIEVYTVENTPQYRDNFNNIPVQCQQSKINNKITICAPTELTLRLSSLESIESSIDEITCNNLNIKKRRGICTSDELREELSNLNLNVCNLLNEDFMKMIRTGYGSEISHDTEGSNKKTSSDSIDLDLDLSFSDINSSDINTFNENIVQKLCLSALKNIKVGNQDADIENIQRIALDILKEMYAKKDKRKSKSFTSKSRDVDTPTEVLSVHDYENMCAVNIAREAWGLRSWKDYTDIENWLHDGSVVRDRRRDTLTSGSSEISSCISQDLKNAILSAQPFPKKTHTYSNVFVKFDRTDQEDYANTVICQEDTFLAKSCVTDKDMNHLEPILEELDDLGDREIKAKKRLNSESSLVATIDEIRKCMVTNSPKKLYNRREHLWDSPQLHLGDRTGKDLKEVLWKEPFKFDASNIMHSLYEKEDTNDECNLSKIDKTEMKLHVQGKPSAAAIQAEFSKYDTKNNGTCHKSSTSNPGNESDQNFEQLLWQLVSDGTENNFNNIPTSIESLLKSDASMQNVSINKTRNLKKSTRNHPRRKFSILRERFEPSITIHSDEETLFHSSESILNSNSSISNAVSVQSELKDSNDSICKISKESADVSQIHQQLTPPIFTVMPLKNVKDKKSLFMKQVLTPPKFNTKLRYKV